MQTFVRGALIRGIRLTLLTSLAVVIFVSAFAGDLVDVFLERGALRLTGRVRRLSCTHCVFASDRRLDTPYCQLADLYAINHFRGILWSQLVVVALYLPLALAVRTTYGSTGLAAAFGIAELAGGVVSIVLAGQASSALAGTTSGHSSPYFDHSRWLSRSFSRSGSASTSASALHPGAQSFLGALLGGAATVVTVSGYLLASDWPEAGVFRQYVPGFRRPQ